MATQASWEGSDHLLCPQSANPSEINLHVNLLSSEVNAGLLLSRWGRIHWSKWWLEDITLDSSLHAFPSGRRGANCFPSLSSYLPVPLISPERENAT